MAERLFEPTKNIQEFASPVEPERRVFNFEFNPREYLTETDRKGLFEELRILKSGEKSADDHYSLPAYLRDLVLVYPEYKDDLIDRLDIDSSSYVARYLEVNRTLQRFGHTPFLQHLETLKWFFPERVYPQWLNAAWPTLADLLKYYRYDNPRLFDYLKTARYLKILYPTRMEETVFDPQRLRLCLTDSFAHDVFDQFNGFGVYIGMLTDIKIVAPELLPDVPINQIFSNRHPAEFLNQYIRNAPGLHATRSSAWRIRLAKVAADLILLSQGDIVVTEDQITILPKDRVGEKSVPVPDLPELRKY